MKRVNREMKTHVNATNHAFYWVLCSEMGCGEIVSHCYLRYSTLCFEMVLHICSIFKTLQSMLFTGLYVLKWEVERFASLL